MWGNYDTVLTQLKDLINITWILFLPKNTRDVLVLSADGAAAALIYHVA